MIDYFALAACLSLFVCFLCLLLLCFLPFEHKELIFILCYYERRLLNVVQQRMILLQK